MIRKTGDNFENNRIGISSKSKSKSISNLRMKSYFVDVPKCESKKLIP
jgi:hypothetical protein